MTNFATRAEIAAYEDAMSWTDRAPAVTLYEYLTATATEHADRNAITFQLFSGATDKAETLSWRGFHAKITQAANLFRSLGVEDGDVVAYLLPNCLETAVTLFGAATAGIVNPINPLLDAEQIAAILRETNAKVLVTLRTFPKTDVAQKAAAAVAMAPNVRTVLEVDLLHYLTPPKSWIVPFLRPKNPVTHQAKFLDFNRELDKHKATLDFEDVRKDRVSAYFHTGGTTGMPKVAQHRYSGMIYNGWLGKTLLFNATDTIICPLPLFHVFAAYPVMMSSIASGAHVVFPTPAGYRGEGVFDNFWKLIERWKVSFVITVPTAMSALMQRPVDADISSLKTAFSGSSPLPVELYHRFEKATGVTLVEGYGMTEATCLVSINPYHGEKKIGSVGLSFPYTDVRILQFDNNGTVTRECGVDEVGEICVSNPGVYEGHTYTQAEKNRGLFADGKWLRTGDLGRCDAEGYLYITGRAKDLIIRGGHNIDPAEIEEALMGHAAVAFVGAIGQPDTHSGEVPCAYVELVAGAEVTLDELIDYTNAHVHERAAQPKYIEILPELPKTAVGKVFKPDLRKMAIIRTYDEALAAAGLDVRVAEVVEDKKRGLVARIARTADVSEADMARALGNFTRPWEWI